MTIRYRFLAVLLMLLAVTGCVSTPPSLSFNGKNSKEGLTTAERQLSMARLGERHGQADTARKIYEKVLAEDPNNVEALHRLGVMAAKKQDYDVAISYLSKAEINDPANIELLNDLGYALFLTDDLSSAEDKLRYAVRLDPSHRAARNNLGLVLGNGGKWDECLVQFRHAVSEAEAYSNLAFVQVQMGELALAEESFLSALDLDADLDAAAEGLVQIKAKKDMLEKRFIADYEAESKSRTSEQIANNTEPTAIAARSLPVSQVSRVSVVAAQPQPMMQTPAPTQVATAEVIRQQPIPVEVVTTPPSLPVQPTEHPATLVKVDRSQLPDPVIIHRSASVQRQVPIETPVTVEPTVVTQQPVAIESPKPVAIESPAKTVEPIVIEKPVAIQEPAIIEKSTEVNQPIVAETPVVIEKPVVSKKPTSFDLPKITKETVLQELPRVVRSSSPSTTSSSPLQPAPVTNMESELKPVQVKTAAKPNSMSSPAAIQPVVVKPVELPKVETSNSVPIVTAAQPAQPHTNIQSASVRPVSVSPVEVREIKVAPVKVEPLSVKTPETIQPATIMPAKPQLDSSSDTTKSSKPAAKPSIWD